MWQRKALQRKAYSPAFCRAPSGAVGHGHLVPAISAASRANPPESKYWIAQAVVGSGREEGLSLSVPEVPEPAGERPP